MNFFDYFQFITLTIFLIVFIGRTLWLRQKGTKVFTLGSGKKGFAGLLEKSFFVFFPVWLLEIGIHSMKLNIQFLPDVLTAPMFNYWIVQIAGAGATFAGLLIFCLALVSFKSSWRVGIDTTAPGDLITTGIFSLSRNPIFFAMDLYFLGTFLIYSNLFFLACFVGMAFGFEFQIRQEEAFLSEKYGKQYKTYTEQVNRYI